MVGPLSWEYTVWFYAVIWNSVNLTTYLIGDSSSNDCICLNDTLTLNCTVAGDTGGITVWSGTAFDCQGSNNEIALIHNRFISPGAFGVCNNGAIVAQGIGVEDRNYTSQLNVTVTSNMAGGTIMCSHDVGSMNFFKFSTIINIATGS